LRKISSLDFILSFNGDVERWCCGKDCPDCVILGQGAKTYYFATDKPDKVNLIVDDCVLDIEKVIVDC